MIKITKLAHVPKTNLLTFISYSMQLWVNTHSNEVTTASFTHCNLKYSLMAPVLAYSSTEQKEDTQRNTDRKREKVQGWTPCYYYQRRKTRRAEWATWRRMNISPTTFTKLVSSRQTELNLRFRFGMNTRIKNCTYYVLVTHILVWRVPRHGYQFVLHRVKWLRTVQREWEWRASTIPPHMQIKPILPP